MFTLSSEQTMLRDSIRRFMKAEIAPIVSRHDQDRTFPFEVLGKLAESATWAGDCPKKKAAWAWTSSPGPC